MDAPSSSTRSHTHKEKNSSSQPKETKKIHHKKYTPQSKKFGIAKDGRDGDDEERVRNKGR